jgi:hypothetical protein
MTTTDDDTNIATAVLNEEMDVASAVEALGEMTDAELKRELLSAAVVGGATLLKRRRSSTDSETDDGDDVDTTTEAEETTAIDVEAVEGESADSDASPDSGSRLVTLPRLAFVALAAGVAYAVAKYRKSQSETTQSTFDDVGVETATAEEDEEAVAEETNATASTESLVDEGAEDEEAAEPSEAAGPESEDITTDVEDVDIDTDVEEDVDTETEAVEEREPETTEAPEPEEGDEDDEK